MGQATPTTQERAEVAHLVRRAAFGLPPEEVDALAALGYEGAVEVLCDFESADPGAGTLAPPAFDTAALQAGLQREGDDREGALLQLRRERVALVEWSLRRMVATTHPLRERLTFHWHDHFATSTGKVRLPELLFRQRAMLHDLGPGRFADLVSAVARDPAMLIWLDGRRNAAGRPNENFARELFELFVLGHGGGGGHAGHEGPYTEVDVAEAARALTGWRIDPRTLTGYLDTGRHDGGTKTVLGATGTLGLAEVVEAATSHPACAPHVVAGLWSRLARPAGVDDPVVRELAATFEADGGEVAPLVRRILLHPEFRGARCRQALVRSPVDHLVGLCRTFRVSPDRTLFRELRAQGQIPFAPPDVDGWPSGRAWLSTASARSRLAVGAWVAARASLDDPGPGARATTLARTLGVERWSPTTASAVEGAPDLAGALTLAAVAPEYVVC